MTLITKQMIQSPIFGEKPEMPVFGKIENNRIRIKIAEQSKNIIGYSFPVSTDLLARAARGNTEALFQLGVCALKAKRFGYAKTIFQMAFLKNHPLAHQYLELTKVRIQEMV